MRALRRRFLRIAALAGLLLAGRPAAAVIVLGGRDAGGSFDNSGTDKNPPPYGLGAFEGQFGVFLGTPIAPRYFISASHLGNQGTFLFNNGTATATTYTPTLVGVSDDLSIFKVADTDPSFSHYATLYRGGVEAGLPVVGGTPGLPLVVMGRSTLRGGEVRDAAGQLRGWEWAPYSPQPLSWGTGVVSSIVGAASIGAPGTTDLLTFGFARQVGPDGSVLDPDRGILAVGDSGGGVFVRDPVDGAYKLAGVNSYVQTVSLASDPNGQAQLNDALFDARGYYDGNTNTLIDTPGPYPLSSYATRIASQIAWIDAVTGLTYEPAPTLFIVPEPAALTLAAIGATGMLALLRPGRRTAEY